MVKFFTAADHLNATAYMQQQKQSSGQIDPLFLVNVNYEVGQRAAAVCAYDAAKKFLRFASQYLNQQFQQDPWTKQPTLTVQVHLAMMEVELIEPELFFTHAPDAAVRLAAHLLDSDR